MDEINNDLSNDIKNCYNYTKLKTIYGENIIFNTNGWIDFNNENTQNVENQNILDKLFNIYIYSPIPAFQYYIYYIAIEDNIVKINFGYNHPITDLNSTFQISIPLSDRYYEYEQHNYFSIYIELNKDIYNYDNNTTLLINNKSTNKQYIKSDCIYRKNIALNTETIACDVFKSLYYNKNYVQSIKIKNMYYSATTFSCYWIVDLKDGTQIKYNDSEQSPTQNIEYRYLNIKDYVLVTYNLPAIRKMSTIINSVSPIFTDENTGIEYIELDLSKFYNFNNTFDDNFIDFSNYFKPGYVTTTNGYISDVQYSGSVDYVHLILNNLHAGMKFKIGGLGASNGRLWATADKYGNIKRLSDSNLAITISENFILTIGDDGNTDETTLIFVSIKSSSQKQLLLINDNINYNYLSEQILINDFKLKSFDDNLVSNYLANFTNAKIYNSLNQESISNYGLENVRYEIPLEKFNKIHVYLEFKYTKALPYLGNNIYCDIARIGNIRFTEILYKSFNIAGDIVRDSFIAIYSSVNNRTFSMTHRSFNNANSRNGEPALTIQYTGDYDANNNDDVIMILDENNILHFKLSNTDFGTVDCSDTSITIKEFIDECNQIQNIEAKFINTFGTFADLCIHQDQEYKLTGISLNKDNENIYNRYINIIRFAHDKKWHSLEFIYDTSLKDPIVAIDGLTTQQNLTINFNGDYTLYLGGFFNLSENSPLKFRNLHIDINHYGDAEIINAPATSSTTVASRRQLISNHNPKILIFEGHGILNEDEESAKEDTAKNENGMCTSTDRLRYIFSEIANRGYVPITYQDLENWYFNDKQLPKRCYLLMFDDYRLPNYSNQDLRAPFNEFNIKPGLAIITDRYDSIDENTFKQLISMGWYPCSHTHTHRRNIDFSSQELIELFKQDIQEADNINIYSDILVYPYGAVNNEMLSVLRLTNFKFAINIVRNFYLFKGMDRFNLARTEIGVREPNIDGSVLAPFV